jgi:predicted transcriptional regulator YheO
MESSRLLEAYIPIVNFIADIIGTHCEVVLHDVTNPDKSVIAIRNGYISGRSLGCPLTDLGLKLMTMEDHLVRDSVVNYGGKTVNGDLLISSTHYIRNEKGTLLGMLCVNILSGYYSPVSAQSGMVGTGLQSIETDALSVALKAAGAVVPNKEPINESFSTSVDQIVVDAVNKLIVQCGVTIDRLSADEKNNIIQRLSEDGIFKVKGSVSKIASILGISESTVYRYLAK